MPEITLPKSVEDYMHEGIGFLVLTQGYGIEFDEYRNLTTKKTLLQLKTENLLDINLDKNKKKVELIDGHGIVRFRDIGGNIIVEANPAGDDNDDDEWYEIMKIRGEIKDVEIDTIEKRDEIRMKTTIIIECNGPASCLNLNLGGNNE